MYENLEVLKCDWNYTWAVSKAGLKCAGSIAANGGRINGTRLDQRVSSGLSLDEAIVLQDLVMKLGLG